MDYLRAIPSIPEMLIVLVIVLVLFGGATKIPQIMGAFGKGIRNFKKSVSEDDSQEKLPLGEEQKQLENHDNDTV